MIQDTMMQQNVTEHGKKKWKLMSMRNEQQNQLIRKTGMKDKLTSYWTNNLFTVAKENGTVIIVKKKRDGKDFARKISMVKKYKHISD